MKRIADMVKKAEFKRQQAPPGPKSLIAPLEPAGVCPLPENSEQ
jgi:hypothetical protein